MAFIPVPDTVEVVITWTGGPKPQKTVINVTSSVAWTIAAAEALLSDIVDAIITDGLPWIASGISAAFLTATDLSSSSGFSFNWLTGSGSNTLPKAGTNGTGYNSAQAALVTTLRTLSRGRSYRGRNYWPGIAVNQVSTDGGNALSTRVTDQDTFVNSLIAAIHSNPVRQLVVVSRHHGGSPLTTGVATPVTSHDTNNVLDTQRRRVQP
jgi:hypothetical protein